MGHFGNFFQRGSDLNFFLQIGSEKKNPKMLKWHGFDHVACQIILNFLKKLKFWKLFFEFKKSENNFKNKKIINSKNFLLYNFKKFNLFKYEKNGKSYNFFKSEYKFLKIKIWKLIFFLNYSIWKFIIFENKKNLISCSFTEILIFQNI